MEKETLNKLYSRCVPFQDSDLYHSSEYTELLLSRKVLLEFLNPEGLPKLKKTLSLLEQTFLEEARWAGRYYFACGVKTAESPRTM